MDPLSYFEREDEVERPVFAELKDKFTSEADEEHISSLPKMTFAMVKPDAFVRGLAPEVISRLKESGLIPVAMKVTEMDETLIDELYMFVKQKYFDSWWIMPKVFSQAPVIPMILIGDPGEFEHLSAKLRDIIGPTTPDAGKPGNLRYDLKGTNRVLNIIHAADDPAAAVREASVFFDLDEILDAMLSTEEVRYDPNEIVPEEPVNLLRWRTFNEVKLEALDYIDIRRAEIQELLDREAEVVAKELPIDEERLALKETEAKLSLIASEVVREIDRELVRNARLPADPKGKGKLAERLEDSLVAATMIKLLSDERALSNESDFDKLLMFSLSRELIGSGWGEVVVHSTWAVMPQMVRDLEKNNKVIVSSS
ncbi:MAG: nucleoside-diphosphate kinase [Candidatus Korarchaeota archaeon]|nr:nucleoside-diphosphate kinase [Candidatus Korarchaeota archaeon]